MNSPENISISVKDLCKDFNDIRALDSVTDNFFSGSLHGIIGPDGAGKTTILRILAGLLHPLSGSVEYSSQGTPLDFSMIRPLIGYMPAAASLYPDLSIIEHIIFFAKLYNLSPREYKEKAETLLSATGLSEFRDRKISKLSGGMYKKAGLICSLLRSPSVLLLDEPTNGVDPISRREFWELLYKLASGEVLIIISTSYMDEAERCGTIHLMDEGRLLESGEPGAVLKKFHAEDFDEIFIKNATV